MSKVVEIPFKPRKHQRYMDDHLDRFNVFVCHRRFGKTLYTIAKLVQQALTIPRDNVRCYYYCPTFAQAKRVSWDYLKELSQPIDDRRINEAELRVDYPNGARIQLGSAENPDQSRGIYADFVAVDEPALMYPRMWSEILRPALADRQGRAIFLGTPAGRHGLLFNLWKEAETSEGWSRFMFKSSETGILPKAELKAAQNTMSPEEYNQEFECSFNAMIKGAYWGREMEKAEQEGRITPLLYDQSRPVHVGMDLGVRHENSTWFFQFAADGYTHFLAYAGYTRMGIPDIIRDWRKREYIYGRCVVPHDIKNLSWSTGHTRIETLRRLGVDALEANKDLSLDDSIEAARNFLSTCKFDPSCDHGLEALRQFSSDWSEKHGVFHKIPLDNWAKDGADAFRYIAITDRIDGPTWKTEPDYSIMDEINKWH